jgi:hypothetical protein
MENTIVPTNATTVKDFTSVRIVTTSDRVACKIEDLPEELAEAISNAKMDPKFNYLNELIKRGSV